nr:DUF58 domain-containing protein [Planosporangium mesophilum]
MLITGPVLLAIGFGFGYPELAVLGCGALVAVLLAVGYALWRPVLGVTRRAEPDRVMRGEDCGMTLTVRNGSRLLAATLVADDRCGPTVVPVPVLRLRPGNDTVTEYPVPTSRRGIVTIGPLRVVRRDPLGLATVGRAHGEVARVWVYPRVHLLSAVPVGVVRSLDGRVDRVPHGTITFDALREYVVGDELRHVHWRTTARIGELMVREHLDTSLPRLVLLLDDRLAAHPDGTTGTGNDLTADSFEAACEAAASIVMATQREELPLALQTVSGEVVGGDGRRPATARSYLDLLAEARLHPAGDGDDLDGAVARLRHRRAGDTLIYLTGPGTNADLGLVGSLRGAYPTIVVGALGAAQAMRAGVEGMVVLSAADGAEFASEWDGVRGW